MASEVLGGNMPDKAKFGLTAQEVRSARERWRRIANDCEWETFDDYLQWMTQSGWSKYMHMAKKRESLPHGPNNSIWLTPDEAREFEDNGKPPSVGNPFCDACKKNGTEECIDYGCAEWRKYFTENWNKNVYRETIEYPKKKESYFCYAHPDDIREGRA